MTSGSRVGSTGAYLYLIWTLAFGRVNVVSLRARATRIGRHVGLPVHLRILAVGALRALLWMGLSALAALVFGCAGTVSAPNNHPAGQTPTAQAYGISGTLSPTAGGSGATVTLSGTSSATTTANSSGAYSFSGLATGTYAVTPSHTGFTFNPTTQSATITAANVTGLNFTATSLSSPTFSISGTITPTAGGSGATVLLSGAVGATTTTNGSGSYTFTGLANGNYIVTPNNSGFAFSPASQNVTVNSANANDVNFTAETQQPHSVTLSWSPSTSTVSGYNVYRSQVSGSGYTKLNSSLLGSLTYSDTTVQSGTTYFYVARSVDSGGDESTNSNQVSAAIP